MPGNGRFEAGRKLMERLSGLVQREHQATTEIVLGLGQMEAESIHLEAGYSSLYAYCIIALGYSEPAALRRIRAARCARRWSRVAEMMKRRELNLTTICALSDVLNDDTVEELLDDAAGKSKEEVNRLIARYRPEPKVQLADRVEPLCVRTPVNDQLELSDNTAAQEETKQRFVNHLRCEGPGLIAQLFGAKASVKTEVEEKLRYTFTAAPEFAEKVKRMKQLLSGKYLRGAVLEEVFMEAMDCYIRHNCPVEKAKRGIARKKARKEQKQSKAVKGNTPSRYIPSDIRMQVLLRDGCRCTYVSEDGRRCGSYSGIQIDHIVPYAKGGSHDPENLRVLCRDHNHHEAERIFGREHMSQFRTTIGSSV